MDDISGRILDYIVANRMSTTEIADALYKTGELNPKLKPIIQGIRAVGFVEYVLASNNSNYNLHEQIKDVQKNKIILADSINCDKALFGELVAKYLSLYKSANGIIAMGLLRDAKNLIKDKYPIWCFDFSPIGCHNGKVDYDFDYYKKLKKYYDDSIIVADDGGVIIIHKNQLTEETYDRLVFIEQQEDEWFNCIDYYKMNTFDTVCLGKRKGVV